MSILRPLGRHAGLTAFVTACLLVLVLGYVGRLPFLVDPLAAQVAHRPGAGYSAASLAAWAALGGLGVLAYAQEAGREPLLRPSNRTLAALLPLLAFGPLYHALLAADALPATLAWPAAEPLVYLSVALVAVALGVAGARLFPRDRARGRDRTIAAGGAVLLLPALAAAAPRLGPDAPFVAGLAAGALLLAALAWGLFRLVPHPWLAEARRPFALAVFFGHALDGFTTWVGVRDPFGWGVGGFAEKNPVSAVLLEYGNGWPFLAIKLLLPAVVLVALRDLDDDLHRRLALLAIFALGFGPGSANAWQMAFRG